MHLVQTLTAVPMRRSISSLLWSVVFPLGLFTSFFSEHSGSAGTVDGVQTIDTVWLAPEGPYCPGDAIEAVDLPTIEVHISDISNREGFRKQSITSHACNGMISGLGLEGYKIALDQLLES